MSGHTRKWASTWARIWTGAGTRASGSGCAPIAAGQPWRMRLPSAGAPFVVALLLTFTLMGCSSASMPSLPEMPSLFGGEDSSEEDAASVPPEQLYNRGDTLMGEGSYSAAAKQFEAVDREHPYSPYARRAMLMAAYSYYKAESYNEAISAAQRYLTLHPGTKETALAHHLIAMSYYDRIEDPRNDQSRTRKALRELKKIRQRYPDSKYAREAENRINTAMDILAGSEMNVGRFYLKRQNYVAAINRFKTVVKDYQTTPHVEEALMRLVEAYMSLGVVNEAQSAAAVLGHNYPNSKWYKDSYALLQSGGLEPREDSGSWVSRTWRRVNVF